MICIFSSSIDLSTTQVIRWLRYLGKNDVIRINHDHANGNNHINIDISEGAFSFQLDDQVIGLNDIEAVWYRKGRNWLCDQFYPVTIEGHSKFTSYLNKKLRNEETTLSEYLHYIIENTVPVLGRAPRNNLNKLLVLCAAKEAGFLIPDFYITNYRKGVQRIIDQSPDLITKSLSDGLYLFENIESDTGYFSYTEKVSEDIAQHLPEYISPSFLQKNILKKYELRVFFLGGKCYSMAILSQTDEQTRVDFRKYNEKKPNRFVPFKLQEEVEQKIRQVFKKIDLNTGSVDLIVDQEENIYFLEINPVGQFGMVSLPCNYFLEKQIALNLMDHVSTYRSN